MKVDPQSIAVLTGLVGTLGGVLISYISLRHSYAKDRHQVQVELDKNILIGVPGTNPRKEYFTIKVANTGHVTFTVASVKIAVGRYSGALVIPEPEGTHPIPTELERDKTCTFWTEYEAAKPKITKLTWRKNSIRVRACISDYVGRSFYSSWNRIHLRETRYTKLTRQSKQIILNIRKFFVA